MKTESDVLKIFSDKITDNIVRKTISELKKIKDCLSGEDTELENAWEEICIQMQTETSYFWKSYDDVVLDIISRNLSKLKPHEILAVWFQTDEGNEWLWTPVMSQEYHESEESSDNGGFRIERQAPPVSMEDIEKYIQQRLYERAENYSNKRITEFLKRY